ncbi:MAG: hypothetical protein ACJ8BW_40805 [Ktedonobacteraceae bacterium]
MKRWRFIHLIAQPVGRSTFQVIYQVVLHLVRFLLDQHHPERSSSQTACSREALFLVHRSENEPSLLAKARIAGTALPVEGLPCPKHKVATLSSATLRIERFASSISGVAAAGGARYLTGVNARENECDGWNEHARERTTLSNFHPNFRRLSQLRPNRSRQWDSCELVQKAGGAPHPNLQSLRFVVGLSSGFSGGQWLCCSTFGASAHV